MEALNQWLSAESNLKRAASDFLDACATLKAITLQSLPSRHGRDMLETALDEVRSHLNSIDIVENQLQASRTTLHSLLNTSTRRVPINRLPSELLSSIFAILLDPPKCLYDYHMPHDYLRDTRLVCVRWNRIIIDTPSFWSHIDAELDFGLNISNIPPIPVQLQLKRSCGVPIHLHVRATDKVSENDVSKLVCIVQPHISRLKSLTVFGTDTFPLVHSLFELYSSLRRPDTLRTLCVANIDEHREEYNLSWPVQSLAGLTEINLERLNGYASPCLRELVTLLSNCSTLHTLQLQFLILRASPWPNAYSTVIHLPCLRLLAQTRAAHAAPSLRQRLRRARRLRRPRDPPPGA
ncbi:hypothetical protein FRC08_010073 [Ceratobasidium sp. 394]|nr:hypothetical protein FRC08_010073 [Ceratobasidium sp. 394]